MTPGRALPLLCALAPRSVDTTTNSRLTIAQVTAPDRPWFFFAVTNVVINLCWFFCCFFMLFFLYFLYFRFYFYYPLYRVDDLCFDQELFMGACGWMFRNRIIYALFVCTESVRGVCSG